MHRLWRRVAHQHTRGTPPLILWQPARTIQQTGLSGRPRSRTGLGGISARPLLAKMKPIPETNESDFGAGFLKSRRSVLENGNLYSRYSTEPPQATCRVTDHSERHLVDQERAIGSPFNRANRLAWEMFGIASFLVFNFVAVIIALYVIWAKCNGNSPF